VIDERIIHRGQLREVLAEMRARAEQSRPKLRSRAGRQRARTPGDAGIRTVVVPMKLKMVAIEHGGASLMQAGSVCD